MSNYILFDFLLLSTLVWHACALALSAAFELALFRMSFQMVTKLMMAASMCQEEGTDQRAVDHFSKAANGPPNNSALLLIKGSLPMNKATQDAGEADKKGRMC